MRKLLYLFLLSSLAFVPWEVNAQVMSLSTPSTWNNGQAGVTFEVIAARTVTVKKIWASMDAGTWNVEVYTRPGGDIDQFTGWTLVGSGSAVSSGGNPYTEINAPLNVNIAAGQNMGFYIVMTNGTAMNYTTATSGGQSAWQTSDQNITIDAYGWGTTYQMTSTFGPRSFNGRVDYVTAGATNDIGVVSIDSVQTACPGQQNIWATIGNFGSNQVNSATVNWTWNGVAQTPISITTQLDTFNGAGSSTLAVFLGTRTFSSGIINNISVSTSAPNGGTDTVAFNNTLTDQLAASLQGTFTINQGIPSGGSNFNSIADAMDAVESFGLCGPTEFHMAEGAYIGQFTLGAIPGASATNTLTIKPNPSNTGNTIIAFNATSSANAAIIRFQGASYINLEGLEFRPLGTSYQRSIEFYGSNDHITIKNCKFDNNPTSTSSYYSHIYNTSGTSNLTEFCTIEGNEFKNGSYAIYWYGGNSTSIKEDGNKFINNTFTDFYYMGLYSVYNKNGVMEGNEIIGRTANRYSTNYGLYRNYDDFGSVTNNRIVVSGTSTNYGLYTRYNDGNSSDRVLIANNMVSCVDNSGTTYGIYCYNNTYSNFYHNTVHANQGAASSSGRPLYAYESSSSYREVEFINNSFSNTGGGYAAYIYNRYGTITNLSNNNFYTTGSTFGYYYDGSGSSTHSTFSSFTNEIASRGANNISAAPLFTSARDLHTITPAFDAAGANGTGIADDIDGDVRCPGAGCPGAKGAPDIGADEFDPPAVDAAATDVSLPCPGLTDVYVTVQNHAVNPLNTVRIICTVNGTPTSGSGAVYNVGGLAAGASIDVNVGNFNFSNGVSYTISATTSDPNGIPDPLTGNDNTSVTGFPSLGGTLTVGGSNPDFATIGAAINAMTSSGICSAVTLLIREGIYNEQLFIGGITGTSATNTITIMPDPSNTQPVEIAYTATSSSTPAVLRFEGASYITLKDIMVSPTGTSYQRGIEFYGSNDHITLDGLTLQNNPTSSSTYYSLIYNISGTSAKTEFTTIQNCTMNGGSYAVYWYGGSSSVTNQEDGNQFLNNTIRDYYYMALYWYYQKNSVIDGNDIEARTSGRYSYNYGIYSSYSNYGQITNNRIVAAGTSSNYGLYIRYNYGSTSQQKLIANNMVSCLDNTGTNYGIYFYNCRRTDVYHNSVLVNKGSTSATGSSRGAYVYGSSSSYNGNNWINNCVANLGGGPAVYMYNRYNHINNMDHNNWYGAGTYLGYYRGPSGSYGYRNSLPAWQSTSGKDGNSLSVNPSYDDDRDLHLSNIQMDAAGDPGVGITTDIDGDTRCPGAGCPGGLGAPDIGADEYEVPPIDLGISALVNPINGLGCDYRAFEPVVVTITNYGSEAVNLALNPATVVVNVTGASTQSVNITIPFGNIPVGGSLSWPVGVINLAIGGTHFITSTVTVNGDGKAKNDSRTFEIDVELVDQFPYSEDFDNMANCSGSASGTCNLTGGWSNDTNDDFDWHVRNNGTSSSSTGPSRDASGNGKYIYTESSYPNYPNKTAIVNMPCVNVGGMTCPVLSFAYHMYGSNISKLEVEIFDGQTWNNVYTLSGQQQSSSGAPWEYAQILLDSYVNTGIIKIRFKGTTGSSFRSDMAIDEVSLLDLATDFQLDAVASTNTATTCDVVDLSGISNVGLLVQKWDITPGIQGVDWDIVSGTIRDRNMSVRFLRPGTYRVSFTGGALCNQGRTDVETIVITRGTPDVDFSVNRTTGRVAADVFSFTDQTAPTAADWIWRVLPGTEGTDYYFSSGNKNSKNPSIIFLRPGTYSVRLTAGTFCGAGGKFKRNLLTVGTLRPAAGPTASPDRLGDGLSINEMNILSVHPNPFNNYLTVNFVSLSEEVAELKLSNMIGQTVHTEVIEEMQAGLKEVKLDLAENLSAGVYILTVRQGTRTKTMKVIKE